MKRRILCAVAGTLFAALAVFIWRLDIPNWKKLDLARLRDMPGTTVVCDAGDMPVGALHGSEHRIWTDLSAVPTDVRNAFIAAEDLRFYRHHGVDLYRMLGALWHDIRTLSYSQGGSTITQQLIKLTHLTQAKTLSRKAQEIVLALRLERVLDKRQILEAYLNAVYFGHGAYGIEAASNTYFGKPASELTLAEGALLAGIIKSPSRYAPHLNGERAVERRNGILNTMARHGMITEQQRDDAQALPLRLAATKGEDSRFAWYIETVLDEAANVLGLSADEIVSGGYTIRTGLNPAMQDTAEALFAVSGNFPDGAEDGTPVQAAFVAADTVTGELRAVVGGRAHDVQRGLNRATRARRQPGSAFKPVSTYAAAIDAFGYLPTSIVDDTPRTFSGNYSPGNAGGTSYGPVTLREALSRSLNIATVALAEEIGTPALRNYAQRFGLNLAPEDRDLSLALGSLTYGVSPAQLCAAYCALANGGTQVKPHAIRTIENSDGIVVYRAQPSGIRAVNPETAYMITDMLKTAASDGSAKALASCGLPVAGKTGTVAEGEGGTRDIWTAAYTPDTAVCAWMGFDQPDPGHRLPASSGGSGYPARLCAAFLSAASSEIMGGDFERPAGVRVALLDGLALRDEKTALLSTAKTPSDFAVPELFHDYDLPARFSENWTAPQPPADFRLLTAPGETPVLAFTVSDAAAEYALIRTVGTNSEEIAALRGSAGQEVRYADTGHDLSQPAQYALLPRNALLYQRGVLLTGSPSDPEGYRPGGLLNAIMGVGEAEAAPTPAELEPVHNQSLFS